MDVGLRMPDTSHVKAPLDWLKLLKVTIMFLPVTLHVKSIRLERPVQFIAAASAGAPKSSGNVKLR